MVDAKQTGAGLRFHGQELVAVATILMAAASVDGDYDGSERDVIEAVLADHASPSPRLPRPVLEALVSFDERSFDLAIAVGALELTDARQRRLLLTLVHRVLAADGVYHVAEELFLDELVELSGSSDAEIRDLRVQLTTLPAWKD